MCHNVLVRRGGEQGPGGGSHWRPEDLTSHFLNSTTCFVAWMSPALSSLPRYGGTVRVRFTWEPARWQNIFIWGAELEIIKLSSTLNCNNATVWKRCLLTQLSRSAAVTLTLYYMNRSRFIKPRRSKDHPGEGQEKLGKTISSFVGEGYSDGQKSKRGQETDTADQKRTRRMISTMQWSVFTKPNPRPVSFAERWVTGETWRHHRGAFKYIKWQANDKRWGS